ncbi:MAG: aromatic acid exporter family protein [Acholeplasmataceae bacterium]|nr:aromatic acid exporter family protein [Acholeplasmataceae bacterium]
MRLLHTAIKMSLVGVLASLVARFLSLDYWLTAGILAILSIHLTKKDSFVISIRRVVDSIFGIMLATLMFIAFGYNFVVFSVFVFIFAYASWVLKVNEGIVPALVLVTHLLIHGEFSFYLIGNELALLFISVGIALIFNLLYPTASEKELDNHVLSIDQLVRDHLFMLALLLKDPDYNEEYYRHYSMLDRKISDTIDIVELVDKDLLFHNDHSYLAYLHMRKEQSSYIRHMYQQALKIKKLHPFALQISDFTRELSGDIGIYNKAVYQLKKLDKLQEWYKESPLPETREEFEIRAALYQILNEIESLLMVKIDFHHQYPEFGNKHLVL